VYSTYFSDVRDRGQPEEEIGEDGGDWAEGGKKGARGGVEKKDILRGRKRLESMDKCEKERREK
jgi:hypothetical protein